MRTPALHHDPIRTSLAALLVVCGLQFPVFGQGQPAPLRSAFMVFRFSRLAPVDIPALAPVRELWRKHTLLIRPPEKALLGISSRQETRPNGKGEGP